MRDFFTIDEEKIQRRAKEQYSIGDAEILIAEFGDRTQLVNHVSRQRELEDLIRQDAVYSSEACAGALSQFSCKDTEHLLSQFLYMGGDSVTQVPWLSPEDLKKLEMPSFTLAEDPKRVGELAAYGRSMLRFIEQAILVNRRAICANFDHPERFAYYAAIGRTCARTMTAERLGSFDKRLLREVQSLMAKFVQQPEDDFTAFRLGKAFVFSGMIDDIYRRARMYWQVCEAVKAGSTLPLVRQALRLGLGKKLLHSAIDHPSFSVRLCRLFLTADIGSHALAASLRSKQGWHYLEQTAEEMGKKSSVLKQIQTGSGEVFLRNLIEKGKGRRFFSELAEGGEDLALLRDVLSHLSGWSLLAEVAQESVEKFLPVEQMRCDVQIMLELHGAISNLHQCQWKGREESWAIQSRFFAQAPAKKSRLDFDDLNEALVADGYSSNAFVHILRRLAAEKLEPLAKAFFKIHRKRYVGLPLLRKEIAQDLLAVGDHKRALAALKPMPKEQTLQCEFLRIAVAVHLKSGSIGKAFRDCKKLLKLDPYHPETINLVAVTLKKQNKLLRSIAYYQSGIARFPHAAKLHHNLALALAQAGRQVESKRSLKVAHQLARELDALSAPAESQRDAS